MNQYGYLYLDLVYDELKADRTKHRIEYQKAIYEAIKLEVGAILR